MSTGGEVTCLYGVPAAPAFLARGQCGKDMCHDINKVQHARRLELLQRYKDTIALAERKREEAASQSARHTLSGTAESTLINRTSSSFSATARCMVPGARKASIISCADSSSTSKFASIKCPKLITNPCLAYSGPQHNSTMSYMEKRPARRSATDVLYEAGGTNKASTKAAAPTEASSTQPSPAPQPSANTHNNPQQLMDMTDKRKVRTRTSHAVAGSEQHLPTAQIKNIMPQERHTIISGHVDKARTAPTSSPRQGKQHQLGASGTDDNALPFRADSRKRPRHSTAPRNKKHCRLTKLHHDGHAEDVGYMHITAAVLVKQASGSTNIKHSTVHCVPSACPSDDHAEKEHPYIDERPAAATAASSVHELLTANHEQPHNQTMVSRQVHPPAIGRGHARPLVHDCRYKLAGGKAQAQAALEDMEQKWQPLFDNAWDITKNFLGLVDHPVLISEEEEETTSNYKAWADVPPRLLQRIYGKEETTSNYKAWADVPPRLLQRIYGSNIALFQDQLPS